MFKMSFIFFLMIALLGCSKNEPQSNTTDFENLSFIKGSSEVLKQNTNYYGVGYAVGKPIKVSSKGLIFNTNEVEVNVGAFGGDYVGNTTKLSIEEDATAREFEKLDRNTLYVFKYEYAHPLNPEIEDTHFHIRSWEPVNKDVSFEYRGVTSQVEKKGRYSKGVRHGKVVQVERWGYLDIDCTVSVALGGISVERYTSANIDTGGQIGLGINTVTTENSITMNTYSEESCAFAEKALKAGVDVSVHYSEDYIEIWDRVNHILHTIELMDSSKEAVPPNNENEV